MGNCECKGLEEDNKNSLMVDKGLKSSQYLTVNQTGGLHQSGNIRTSQRLSGEVSMNNSRKSSAPISRDRTTDLPYIILTDEEIAKQKWMRDRVAPIFEREWQDLTCSTVSPQWYSFKETQEIYRGELKEQKRDGFGEQYWPDGSAYKGYWKNNKMSGRGTYVGRSGEVQTGEWVNNQLRVQRSVQ